MRKVVLTPELMLRIYRDRRFRAALAADGESAWRERGACTRADDPDLFFPTTAEHLEPARRVCGLCPVAGECLAEALSRTEIDGIWGGTTSAERRSMRAVWRQQRDQPLSPV